MATDTNLTVHLRARLPDEPAQRAAYVAACAELGTGPSDAEYWRWRSACARLAPSPDPLTALMRISNKFGASLEQVARAFAAFGKATKHSATAMDALSDALRRTARRP